MIDNKILPALRGRGTPPTKTVFRGSSGIDASKTKSASDNLHGLICTGLSLIVGDDTQRYSLSSSVMHASIKLCTEFSSCKHKIIINRLRSEIESFAI